MPRISVLSLGGTIAMTPSATGAVPTLTATDLVAAVPALHEVAEIVAEAVRQVPGASLTFDDLGALAAAIDRHIDAGADGVVVTQGTDTLEETAFALDLLLAPRAPVVVTGAMRTPGQPGADGPANLLAAMRTAAEPRVAPLGVVVVLNDEIHAARWVRKQHTTSPAAFGSPLAGPVGILAEGTVVLLSRPLTVSPTLRPGTRDAAVALLTTGLGDDGRLIAAAETLGYAGVVVEATGGGHVAAALAEPLGALARRLPVVLAARGRTGRVLTATYGFPGSETDLLARGLLPAGTLDGVKARVLLSLLLRADTAQEGIAETFAAYG